MSPLFQPNFWSQPNFLAPTFGTHRGAGPRSLRGAPASGPLGVEGLGNGDAFEPKWGGHVPKSGFRLWCALKPLRRQLALQKNVPPLHVQEKQVPAKTSTSSQTQTHRHTDTDTDTDGKKNPCFFNGKRPGPSRRRCCHQRAAR